MHATVIPQSALLLDARLRGERADLPLDPKTTAHVIIDLQTGFIAPGSVAETPMNLLILPNVDKISVADIATADEVAQRLRAAAAVKAA